MQYDSLPDHPNLWHNLHAVRQPAYLPATKRASCRVATARFDQSSPLSGPVEGGGPTIWMGGTAPTIFQDRLYVVTGAHTHPLP